MQTYEEALDFLDHIGKYSSHPGIENTSYLLSLLGHPERGLKIIHVAGTNGKGSVCAFLADMLTARGYRTGLFTSPHLVDVRERIQLDRELIGPEDFAACLGLVRDAADALSREGYTGVTYFDYLFAAALCWYREKAPDYVVVETGLGGRLDSTSAALFPVLTIITSISLDHTELLGDTVAKIAAEKAGIIVSGMPLIYCNDDPEASRVITEEADRRFAPYIGIGRRNCSLSKEPSSTELMLPGQELSVRENSISAAASADCLKFTFRLSAGDCGPLRESIFSTDAFPDGICETLVVNSPALYQAENAAIAYTAALWLHLLASPQAQGPYRPPAPTGACTVPDRVRADLLRGLAGSAWEGRFEQAAPGVYLDGAHNADGIRMLLASVRRVAAGRPVTLLFSAVKEKDTSEMIREICESGLFCRYLVTTVGGARAIGPEQLKECFLAHSAAPVAAYHSPQEAFLEGRRLTGPDEILLCAGSLYLVGIIKELLLSAS